MTARDLGRYECQLNTAPVKLRVVALVARPAPAATPPPRPAPVPEAGPGSSTAILGAPDIYFVARPGSLVNITCVVHSLKQPEHIFWYHDGQVTGVSVMARVSSVLTSSVVNSSPNINRLRHYMLCKNSSYKWSPIACMLCR